jgi:hypothetical protein
VDGKGSGLSKGFLGALLSDLVVLPDNPPSTQLYLSDQRSQRLFLFSRHGIHHHPYQRVNKPWPPYVLPS